MKNHIIIVALMLLTCNFSQAQMFNTLEARYQNKPIVQMELNGKKTWVLLDTGSDISILNIRSQDKYGFNAHEDAKASVVGLGSKHNPIKEVSNAQLYFGDIKLKSQFYAYDINNIVASIRARSGISISAIIGTSLMREYGFVLDMGSRTVTMTYKVKKKDLKESNPEFFETIAKND